MQTSEGKVRNASEYESPNCDFGRYSQGEVALDVKHGKMMTQGAWMNTYNGSERRTNECRWHWMPNRTKVLNVKTKKGDDSKCMNGYEKEKKKTALNAKLKEKMW